MTRSDKLKSLKTDAWYNRLYNKLNVDELELCNNFIKENDNLDRGSFEMKMNRMFLDKPKPKNWKIISELLMISNMT